MNTSQEQYLHNDEIDLIDLFAVLWKKKTAIFLVTFLFLLGGVMYLVITPGKYVGEVVLRGPFGAQLVSYAPLNDGIKKHYGDFLVNSGRDFKEINQFEVTTDSLVNDMVRELQDYDEVEIALKEHIPQFGSMSEAEFEDEKSWLFSKFKIIRATERNPEVRISLEWPDDDQLLEVLSTTLALAEQNLNIGKIKFLNGLADNIERRNSAEVKALDRVLTSKMKTIDLKMQGKLLFLKEQAKIARELGFAENKLTEGGQDNQVLFNQVLFNNSSLDEDAEMPLDDGNQNDTSSVTYLRGYKSLEKEASLISARVGDQNYLLDSDFMGTKARVIELKNNGDAAQFRESIVASPFASTSDIFNIKMDTIWIKNTRNAALILAFSVILGFVIGSVVVLVRNAMSGRRNRLQLQT